MKASEGKPSKGLNIAAWVVQIMLILAFGMAGIMKATTPMEQLIQEMDWANAVPAMMVRFIGVSELLGALGLLLPSVTRIKPILTPIAAAALVVVMGLALGFHLTRAEWSAIPINGTLGAMAAFVAWVRLYRAPIRPR